MRQPTYLSNNELDATKVTFLYWHICRIQQHTVLITVFHQVQLTSKSRQCPQNTQKPNSALFKSLHFYLISQSFHSIRNSQCGCHCSVCSAFNEEKILIVDTVSADGILQASVKAKMSFQALTNYKMFFFSVPPTLSHKMTTWCVQKYSLSLYDQTNVHQQQQVLQTQIVKIGGKT